ncbi:MAG TPA: MDR family MFS transporter [Steroidobacteraceae bacterium]|nr:MDR family MFS transporter [Steroidobacteraceae bacterium]
MTVPSSRKAHRPLTVVGVLLSMFMGAMEATIVATAMPTVVEKLGGIEYYGWVGAVYLLTSTVAMPLYGKVSDLYGRKPIMLLAMAIFLVGSMASGLSRTMTQLIVFRALQGAGAGGLQPVSITIIGDIYEPAERARMQGVFGAVWGVAAMSGPLLGGLIVATLSWRWIFFINVPFGLLSAFLISTFFHEHAVTHQHRLDLGGAALLTGSIVSLLLGAGRFAPAVTLPAAALLLAGFIAVESRVTEPVLSLALLRRRVIGVASAAGAAVGAVMSSTVIYLPLYVQAVLAGTPTQAGATVSTMLIGWPIASTLGGRLLPHTGYRPLVRSGFATVMIMSIALAVLLREGASTVALAATMFVMGAGMGIANSALIIAVQESATWNERGVATASTLFFRTIGGAVAVGALGAVLAAGIGPNVPAPLLNELLAPDHGGIDPQLALHLAGALRAGLEHVFDLVALLSVGAAAAALLFPDVSLAPREPSRYVISE